MNPPSDPSQLLVYGIGTLLGFVALKLWDRRRDKRLQSTADAAAAHAAAASEHAEKAVQATADLGKQTPTKRQAERLLEAEHDASALLTQILLRIGALQADVKRLNGLPERVARIEEELDGILLDGPIRRRQERS